MRLSVNSKQLAAGSFLIYSCLFLSGCVSKETSGDKSPGTASLTPLPTKPLELTINERPLVILTPTSDGHWINLEVTGLKPAVKSIEYELVYFATEAGNQIERGTTGAVDLNGQSSLTRKILFGTESCTNGCKYRFEENVSEGVLTLKLKSDSGTEKYETAFRLQKGSEGKEGLTTGDGSFKFIAANLPAKSYFVTISTIGVPGKFSGTIATLPYGDFPSVSAKGEAAFKTTNPEAKILFWNNQKWEELKSSYANGWLTASVAKTGIFVLVK